MHPRNNVNFFKLIFFSVLGQMNNIKKDYFETGLKSDFHNCTLGVIAMPYKPFVIGENNGIEVKILKRLEKEFNIHFNITISNFSASWGKKTENNSWTDNLRMVYEQLYFGIGNVDTGRDINSTDFSFSIFYLNEALVFVVPIAQLVPEWRILIAIFNEEMWGICLAIILIFAIIFCLCSLKSDTSTVYYRHPLFTSYQMFLSYAVNRHPKTEILRVFFLSMSVFSIIVGSLYTCSLLYYLKNPIREYQPDQNTDIVDENFNLKYRLGGLSKYGSILNGTKYENDYLKATGQNDNIDYWLEQVAIERDIWTVSSSLYAKYSLAQNSNVTTDANGVPRVFVFKNKLSTYHIAMVARNGHPLLKKSNKILKKMLYGGLITHYLNKYVRYIDREISLDTASDSTLKPLTLRHLQGAFFILFCGYVYAFIVLFFEIVIYKFKKRFNCQKRKHRQHNLKIKKTNGRNNEKNRSIPLKQVSKAKHNRPNTKAN